MEIGKDTYISLKHQKEDYKCLKLSVISEKASWEKAIIIFDNRLRGRFINPIKEWVKTEDEAYAFSVMAIECLLVETLYQFKKGLDKTENSTKNYPKFLEEILIDPSYSLDIRERFYREIRCGILHSGQTKKNSSLNYDKNEVITLDEDRMSVNVEIFLDLIEKYFEKYKTDLLDENNADLRKAFIKKMNFICDK
ncbi:MAG: hypothetical protein IJO08_03060 [Clostridia bacterium]|nr:hypothetical protein [Clostridia bacterium]